MTYMEIPSKNVYEILKEKGVESIHHANSVITSCQFLRKGFLMSRGTIDRNKLFQTTQKSDKIDQELGVWFDIFADSVDIHHRAKRSNVYGPVLFELDVEIIKKAYTGRIWVTKCNPTKWDKNTEHEDRWFTSTKDLEANFNYGTFDQMIVFRHCGGELSFKKYLKKIVIDEPKLKSKTYEIDYFSMAYGAISLSMTEGGIAAPIEKRICKSTCTCIDEYRSDLVNAEKMFRPKI